MTPGFETVLAASAADRQDLFLKTAGRLGTPIQNVEKDFWVCWVLDLMFGGQAPGEPRLLFKGGTSLSKAYGLISRFSEDIDITVFREDLGQGAALGDLEALSGKQQQKRLDSIKQACQAYVQGPLQRRLNQQAKAHFSAAGISVAGELVMQDPDDPEGQSLLLRYPSISNLDEGYLRPSVKIEAGAKSALDPHRVATIQPYIADAMRGVDLVVKGVTTIDAERSFWDKVVILHGLRQWHDRRGLLKGEGHRVSRHYYDIHQLIHSVVGPKAAKDRALAMDCARHARIFFSRPDLGLETAQPGSFTIVPSEQMMEALKRDYLAMAGMIFGQSPAFGDVMEAVRRLEQEINESI